MKRLLRWLVRLVLIVLVLMIALIAYVYIASGRLMARTYPSIRYSRHPAIRPASLVRSTLRAGRRLRECRGEPGGRWSRAASEGTWCPEPREARWRRSNRFDGRFVRSPRSGKTKSVIFVSADYQFTGSRLGSILGYIRSMPPVDRTPPPMTSDHSARGSAHHFRSPTARIDHANVRLGRRRTRATGPREASSYPQRDAEAQWLTTIGGVLRPGGKHHARGYRRWTESGF